MLEGATEGEQRAQGDSRPPAGAGRRRTVSALPDRWATARAAACEGQRAPHCQPQAVLQAGFLDADVGNQHLLAMSLRDE